MFLYKTGPSTAPFEEADVIKASKTEALNPSTASDFVKVSPVLGLDQESGAFCTASHNPVSSLTGLSLFVIAFIKADVGENFESGNKS